MKRATNWGLYLVTDHAIQSTAQLERLVARAVEGGVTVVQLREKRASTRDFVERARRVMDILAPHAIPLLINDRIDVALAVGAAGVHLGQDDLPVAEARRLIGPDRILGLSVETLEQARIAEGLEVDYLGVSPIFPTPTKTDTRGAWGLEGLARLRAATRLPLVAIGGIHPGNVADVVAAGADGVAVVSALCSAADPAAVARDLRQRIEQARRRPTDATGASPAQESST